MLSAAVRPILAEQYADMLTQDYRLRNVLLSSYHHSLDDLLRFEHRMLASLEGMALLKKEATDYLHGQLGDVLSPGDLFSIALFAVNTDEEYLLSGCLGLVQAIPRLLPALLDVTTWVTKTPDLWPLIMAHPACRAYLAVTYPQLSQTIVFSQQEILTLIERDQCVEYLLYFLHSSGSSLFFPTLNRVLSSEQDSTKMGGCRAVYCLDRSSDKHIYNVSRECLHYLTSSKNSKIRAEAVKYLVIYHPSDAAAVINALLGKKTDTRLLIQALGWSGLVEHIPVLMTYFDEPEYARLSALSVIAMTGSLPERDNWQKHTDDPVPVQNNSDSSEIPTSDPEQGVCWPDAVKFSRWWQTHQPCFHARTPYLGGQPATQEGLLTVIADGFLNLRPMAAMRLGINPERVRLPARCQRSFLLHTPIIIKE